MGKLDAEFSGLSGQEVSVLLDIAEIAGAGLPVSDSFAAVFESIERLVPLAAGALCVPDPRTGYTRTVASRGYSTDLLDFVNDGYRRHDPAYEWMRRTGAEFANWRSPDFDYSRSASVHDWFRPAGFSGGSTSRLRVRGRGIGELHLSTDDPRWPPPRTLAVIGRMAPLVAAILGDLIVPQRLLDSEPPGTCGTIVIGDGTVALPGRRPCEVLKKRKDVVESLRRIAAREVGSMGSRYRWFDGADWQVVIAVPLASGLLVMHRAELLPLGLTARQLEVMTLVAGGATNQRAAKRLGVTPATVSRHLEHIMDKLGVDNRVALSRIVHEEGLRLLLPDDPGRDELPSFLR
ncbi:response regulator transcription factor [Gordonia phosphorivorans]|uniref:Response regulator transcription factor n=1 Tax=Gordonia phosphorivorans TaxID=1056982 RepID=A0ABV6HB62_9ACTN